MESCVQQVVQGNAGDTELKGFSLHRLHLKLKQSSAASPPFWNKVGPLGYLLGHKSGSEPKSPLKLEGQGAVEETWVSLTPESTGSVVLRLE